MLSHRKFQIFTSFFRFYALGKFNHCSAKYLVVKMLLLLSNFDISIDIFVFNRLFVFVLI